MARAKLSFPVFSFRRIETPFDKSPGLRNHVAVVEVSKLPDLTDWREINVRDPRLTGSLTKHIRESFLSNKETFVFLNRGLVVSVEHAEFDNRNGILHLTLTSPDVHGLLDGGHTYEIIKKHREDLSKKEMKQYVKVEIVEGFDQDDLVKLVEARNSSNQVRDESLMNLADEFKKIKKALAGAMYQEKIAYSEYEVFPGTGDPKPISIREIISYLMTMDRRNFGPMSHPINAYRSKAACLKHFKEHKEDFEPIYPIAKDVLRLWDTIHLELPAQYNRVRGERGGVSGGRFGKLTGVVYLERGSPVQSLDFLDDSSAYVIPAGFKYPILGAFRALLVEEGRRYVWGKGIDPIHFLRNGLGKDLAQTIGEFALDAQNPSKTGKAPLVWQSCYQCAELAFLRIGR